MPADMSTNRDTATRRQGRLDEFDDSPGDTLRARTRPSSAMSTARHPTESRPSRRACRYPPCAEWGTAETFATTRYCSEACKTRHDGRKALAQVIRDHRYCGNCGHLLKDVEHPPDDLELRESGVGWTRNDDGEVVLEAYGQEETRHAIVGFQYRLRTAAVGEKVRNATIDPPVIGTGTVCGVCGATDLSDPVPWAEHTRLIEAAGLFCDALRREGVADVSYRVVLDTVVETGDMELAIGRGVDS